MLLSRSVLSAFTVNIPRSNEAYALFLMNGFKRVPSAQKKLVCDSAGGVKRSRENVTIMRTVLLVTAMTTTQIMGVEDEERFIVDNDGLMVDELMDDG